MIELRLSKKTEEVADIFVSAVTIGYGGYSLMKFEPHSAIPADNKVAPYVRYLGMGMLALGGYQLFRAGMLYWKGRNNEAG